MIDLSQHFAVFCDEAQDFTKLELELIFRLSLFAKRQVDHFQLQKVPFAFAGDPFQTLNPTGFDWDATQASFHDNIVRRLDPAGQADLSFNFKNLAFNYRSTRPIVQFCNLIQLVRGRAFGQRSLKPQKTWQVGPAADPVYYDISQPICRQALQNEAALVVIVPCQEGEEEKYVQNDDFLRQIAWDSNSETIIRDVLSPMRAKGLQFKRVVLYKFGEYALRKYGPTLARLTEPADAGASKEETLPIEYFVNQLYVAASRPRQQLIIVDTDEGIDEFWRFAIDENQEALVASYESRHAWSIGDITRILRGDRKNWEQSRDDARQLGQDFFARAKHGADPYLMDRAIQNFEAVGDEASAAEALALKYEYENNLIAAGDVYASKLEQLEKAIDCYWIENAFKEIVDLGNRRTELASSIRHRAAAFMLGKKDARITLKFIEHVYAEVNASEDVERAIITSDQWQGILQHAFEALAHHADTPDISNLEWKRLWLQIDGLRKAGVDVPGSIALARLAYRAERIPEAREILDQDEKGPEDGLAWIVEVFAGTTAYPDNLRWLDELGVYAEIIREFNDNPESRLSEQDQRRVFGALLREKNLAGAYDFVVSHPNPNDLVTLLDEAARHRDDPLSRKVAGALLEHLVDQGQWDAAIQFADSLSVQAQYGGGKARDFEVRWNAVDRHAFLIRKLARSRDLERATVRGQLSKVSSYLAGHLMPASEELRSRVGAREAGAAFERAGKFVDSLAYYETVRNGAWGVDNNLKKWARLRWLKNKYRQADYYDNEAQRQRALQEARSHEQIWHISSSEVDEATPFPSLGQFVSADALPAHDAGEDSTSSEQPSEVPSVKIQAAEVANEKPNKGVSASANDVWGSKRTANDNDAIGASAVEERNEGEVASLDDSAAERSPTFGQSGDSKRRETEGDVSSSAEVPMTNQDVVSSVSIDIEIGDLSYRAILHSSRRTLEIRHGASDDALYVRASDGELVDPMSALSFTKEKQDESYTRWLVFDWELAIEIVVNEESITVHLQHLESGETVLALHV